MITGKQFITINWKEESEGPSSHHESALTTCQLM